MASSRASELNGGDDEEAALRRAIAMSLGETLSDDDNAGPSKTDGPSNARNGVTMSPVQSHRATPPAAQPAPGSNSMAALGIDRKKMEEERLARLRKRKAEGPSDTSSMLQSDTNGGPPTRRPRLMDDQPARVARAPLQRSAPSPNSNSYREHKASPTASAPAGLPYPKGAVLRTWARGTPRNEDITIEEVFQKEELELAVLSSYQWDENWLMGKLDMRKTKVLLVAYAENDEKVRPAGDHPRVKHPLPGDPQDVFSYFSAILKLARSWFIPQFPGKGHQGAADLADRKPKCATMYRNLSFASSSRRCKALEQCTASCSS